MPEITRSQLVEDSVFILQCLRQNQRGGRQNGLAEVRSTLEGSVALDPGAYVAFLNRFGYLEIDADAVHVTPQGERAATGAADVSGDVQSHFAEVLEKGAAFDVLLEQTQPGARVPGDRLLVVPSPALDPVEGELGQGPLARVRAARYGELGAMVAVKEYKPLWDSLPWLERAELSRRVRREAQAQAQLSHPCVLRIFDVRGEDSQVLMPLAASTLREKLRTRERLPLPQAARIGAQTAFALAHAHGQGLIHGALKPENVLLDRDGNVQLSDFGAARLVALPAMREQGPRVVVELGDAAYRAPEVCASEPALAQADAFALGTLLRDMLAGAPGAELPPELPAAALDLVTSLRDADPARRPTLAAAASWLTALLGPRPLYLL
jgi:tRNA A-37 threonylcarbamoyl transferase component Bud32